jgi:hypothetical protein
MRSSPGDEFNPTGPDGESCVGNIEDPQNKLCDQWAAKVFYEEDFNEGYKAASTYKLEKGLDLSALINNSSFKDWRAFNTMRVKTSYQLKSKNTIWNDDKIDQRCIIENKLQLVGQLYVPYLLPGSTLRAIDSTDAKVEQLANNLTKANKPMVVKATGGANSEDDQLFPFCGKSRPDATELKNAIKTVLKSKVASFENWQIQMVLPGVLAEVCYNAGVKLNDDLGYKPLEMKVQTMWGKVVGATLETHPSSYWIRRDGTWYKWKSDQTNTNYWRERERVPLTSAAWNKAVHVLKTNWIDIVRHSEQVAGEVAATDELRVDWFVGDEVLGVRLNEISYMAGSSRWPKMMQEYMMKSFLGSYRHEREPCSSRADMCVENQAPSMCHSYKDEVLPRLDKQYDKIA